MSPPHATPLGAHLLSRTSQPCSCSSFASPGPPNTASRLRWGLLSDGGKEVPPRYVLRSLQELKKEAAASGKRQMPDFIEVSCQDVTLAASKEKGKKKKVHQTLLPERKALKNWHHHMTTRKTQEKCLGEILQRPEDELVMNVSENYRQIQEERELIDLSLPTLLPGKGRGKGSEFWKQPERIGDELTGLTMTLTRRERGYLEPITHVGNPPAVQLETGLKPPKKIPFHETWDKSLFLKQRRQEIKPVIEELDFYKPDLDGLEVVGKGQPFTSVSTEPSQHSTTSEESETLSDSLQDKPDVVPEAIQGPSLDFGGYPARWINYTTPCRDKVGITAAVMFETKMRELAENSLTVSNDGTTAIWYQWLRLPKGICTKETKGMRMPCFYFDIRSGVILPGQTKKFCVLFKSGRAGVFSEYWEFRTHPVLLGGASLQVLLCGLAEYVDEWADVREKLQRDLDARVAVSIAKESLRRCLDQIRTPERSPSPLDFCITEEELFHQKNPELHYQHQVVKQLHELWRKHVDVPSAFEVKEPSGQESISEVASAKSSVSEVSGWKDMLEEDLGLIINVEKEDEGPSGWNYSFEDFKQALLSVPDDEQREAALAQLNKAIEELRVKQRPTQCSLLYQTGLMLWSETIDNMVSCSMRLRASLGLPENTAYLDDDVQKEAEETVEVKDTVLYQQYRESLYIQVGQLWQPGTVHLTPC
ncbi:PREDICTED: MYCBP-associated protein [Chaetura pelagica]|uniref:MYCBP-associated protein n=1 Tax=Chaetura pelagica TaxID=8897 RepID=UPI000523EEC2|nr:PREDICTED: MYCBP-associated protein [Chaetura pelagica]